MPPSGKFHAAKGSEWVGQSFAIAHHHTGEPGRREELSGGLSNLPGRDGLQSAGMAE